MQKQNLQQSFIKTNAKENNINCIHLAKKRYMINGVVAALKIINNTAYNNNLAINSLNYATNFVLTLPEIDHRLIQLHNELKN